ncbi:MAG: hypothetical protein KKH68_01715, partial [Proteobacteria bacterium]|nr:hypothetical protein [Pseudomonadota bacterium]
MASKPALTKHLFPFLFYTLFFLALFSQFPLKKSLPGNCESWLVISLSNTYLEKITAFLTELRVVIRAYFLF